MFNKAQVKLDQKTKNLISRLNPGDIAIINHQDIDEVAAYSLASKRVAAVINCSSCISGKYPNLGPSILAKNKIPLYEAAEADLFQRLKENDTVEIRCEELIFSNQKIADLKRITEKEIEAALEAAEKNIGHELSSFIDNTLSYAYKEKRLILEALKIPNVKTNIYKRHVLVVVRGKDYRKDLEAISAYLKEVKPILIGVDGGGDALLESGLAPDILIGDMDSVSDRCLRKSKEIIVHAYENGSAPGLERVKALGLQAHVLPSLGTSEDVAMLLVYEMGAELIVAVGTHTNMVDFLEKGRKGMASTLLVRMKIGTRLVDAKGVNQLYCNKLELKHFLWLAAAAIIPIVIIASISPPLQILIRLLSMRLRLFIGR